MSRLQRLERLLSARRAELNAAQAEQASASTKLKAAEASLKAWQEAREVLQQAAEAVQNLIHTQVEDVVTRCVQAVYGDEISFHVEFAKKRGKTEARLFFKKGGYEYDPVEASSLGVVDVACFGLRLAVLRLHNPPVAQVMVCDEPLRYCDSEAVERFAVLLEALAKETGTQFVIVSHHQGLRVGKIVKV